MSVLVRKLHLSSVTGKIEYLLLLKHKTYLLVMQKKRIYSKYGSLMGREIFCNYFYRTRYLTSEKIYPSQKEKDTRFSVRGDADCETCPAFDLLCYYYVPAQTAPCSKRK